MGNCCGKASSSFKGEGRTLGAQPANAPPQANNARAAAPPKINTSVGGRTLGSNTAEDPKTAAARAAEERAKAAQGKGKLGKQLNLQKG